LEHLEHLIEFGEDLSLALTDLVESCLRILGGMALFLGDVALLLGPLPGPFLDLPHDLVREARPFRVLPPVLLGLPAIFRVFAVPLGLLMRCSPAVVTHGQDLLALGRFW
jgi:hypothetical protein